MSKKYTLIHGKQGEAVLDVLNRLATIPNPQATIVLLASFFVHNHPFSLLQKSTLSRGQLSHSNFQKCNAALVQSIGMSEGRRIDPTSSMISEHGSNATATWQCSKITQVSG